MLRVLAAAALTACLAAVAMPAVPAQAVTRETRECVPASANVLGSSARVQVYIPPSQRAVYGCVRGSKKHRRLGIDAECPAGQCEYGATRAAVLQFIQPAPPTRCASSSSTGCGLLGAVAVAGDVTAFEEFHEQPGDEAHELTIIDLANGRVLHRFAVSTSEWLPGLLVTPHGSVAWLQFEVQPGCFSWGHDGNSCSGTFSVYSLGAEGSRTLASGLQKKPSLTLSRGTLRWSAEGAPHSTSLR